MTTDKLVLVLGYLVTLLACALLPFLLIAMPRWRMQRPAGIVGGGMVGAALALAAFGPYPAWSAMFAAPLLALPLLAHGTVTALGGLLALPLLAPIIWWAPGSLDGAIGTLAFLALGLAALALPRRLEEAGVAADRWGFALLAAIAAVAALAVGNLAVAAPLRTLWHHWGAYIAPAQAMLAGGIPFADVPLQYGLGPGLLIMAGCRVNCWLGVYIATALANALQLIALGGCVLALARGATPGLAWLGLAALVASTLVWAAFPVNWVGPLATPSVAGLRFAPIALLLWHILAERGGDWRGHGLWLLGLAWSPEAAVFATILWWPWLCLRAAQPLSLMHDGARPLERFQADGQERETALDLSFVEPSHAPDGSGHPRSARAVATMLLRGAAAAGIALAVALAGLALAFRLGFGEWPSLAGYLTYLVNPPGTLPPNFLGPLLLVLASVATLAVAIGRADPRRARQGFACLLTLLAVGAYYLGRSHDNNLLNLFPFLVVVLTAALAIGPPPLLAGFARMALVGLVAWTVAANAGPWRMAWASGAAAEIGPAPLLRRLALRPPDGVALLEEMLNAAGPAHAPAADAAAALAWLEAQGEPVPLWVSSALLLPAMRGEAWTGMGNLANFALLPRPVILGFIARGAARFARPGWLLVDPAAAGPWLGLFQEAGYRVTEERWFGAYVAYRLAPG